jgi:hypothetical protein
VACASATAGSAIDPSTSPRTNRIFCDPIAEPLRIQWPSRSRCYGRLHLLIID